MPAGRTVSGSILKYIAAAAMLLDHIGAVVLEPQLAGSASRGLALVYLLLRCIGRLAFPIFCFLLTEGVRHTSNARRYALRLLLFALLSELPFNYATTGRWLDPGRANNVFFTLLFGFSALQILRLLQRRWGDTSKATLAGGLAAAGLCAAAAEALGSDYGALGVLAIVLLYIIPPVFPQNKPVGFLTAILPLFLLNGMEWFALPDIWLLAAYNGTRGRQHRAFFYLFYPLHLLALGLLAHAI